MSRTAAVTVSVVLIVKNEEDVLEKCLASVQWADEVVVYDTGSTDGTLEIARRLATTVVEGYWDDDFGAARNRAAAHATGEWILAVDADEVVEADTVLVRRRAARTDADQLIVTQVNEQRRGPAALVPTARFVRRTATRWVGELHEQPVAVPGTSGLRGALPHLRLLHSGYDTAAVGGKGKAERNLRIARRDLARAVEGGASVAERASRETNLARTLLLARRWDEALDLASRIRDGGTADPDLLGLLAQAVCISMRLAGRDAEGDEWFEVWHANASNRAWPMAEQVRHRADRGDAGGTLAALAAIPTTTVDGEGRRLDRIDLAQYEIWALALSGRTDEAVAVARNAVRRGLQPASPWGLLRGVGAGGLETVAAELDHDDWTAWVLQCARRADGEARAALRVLGAVRPDDAAAALAAALTPTAWSLEEATEWSVTLRRLGLPDRCLLTVIACDEAVDPRQRALAGALAWDVFSDDRARAGLADALEALPPEHEAELLAQLDVVAPGLVSPAG